MGRTEHAFYCETGREADEARRLNWPRVLVLRLTGELAGYSRVARDDGPALPPGGY